MGSYELEICREVILLKATDDASARLEADLYINGPKRLPKIDHYVASNTSVVAELREVRVVEQIDVFQATPGFFPG